ncbi:MAG: hypothetical protein VX672_07255 [Planctomycetota bacterium]|nr:hypothetical protein [Planctomycetota bacterium]
MAVTVSLVFGLLAIASATLATAEIRFVDRDPLQNGFRLVGDSAPRGLREAPEAARNDVEVTEIGMVDGTCQTIGKPLALREVIIGDAAWDSRSV